MNNKNLRTYLDKLVDAVNGVYASEDLYEILSIQKDKVHVFENLATFTALLAVPCYIEDCQWNNGFKSGFVYQDTAFFQYGNTIEESLLRKKLEYAKNVQAEVYADKERARLVLENTLAVHRLLNEQPEGVVIRGICRKSVEVKNGSSLQMLAGELSVACIETEDKESICPYKKSFYYKGIEFFTLSVTSEKEVGKNE